MAAPLSSRPLSSASAVVPTWYAAYAASKAGLNGFVQSLAAEHASEGIRINALLPGGTVTPAGGEGNPETLKFVSDPHPMKRMASALEIAQAALFLLSDRSQFMTGSPSGKPARPVRETSRCLGHLRASPRGSQGPRGVREWRQNYRSGKRVPVVAVNSSSLAERASRIYEEVDLQAAACEPCSLYRKVRSRDFGKPEYLAVKRK